MRVLIDAATPAVAVTIFGGLISATLLDMLLTPVLFLRYGGKSLERLRRDAAASPIPLTQRHQPKPSDLSNGE
jgi:heavy-metal exporter, HME family